MSRNLTEEQLAAVQMQGKLIVSASAGSGKTFVMIKKIADLIESGADIDEILAVTFTNKAAAQMKEKLRLELISRIETADEGVKSHLKEQLSKIPSANVSTVHSFCSQLLRTYFYELDIDGSFDIISDESDEAAYMSKAMEFLCDRLYESVDKDFMHLLSCFRRKRSDAWLKTLITEGFKSVKNTVNYREKLKNARFLFSAEGFDEICAEHHSFAVEKLRRIERETYEFYNTFNPENKEAYGKRFNEILTSLEAVINERDIFKPLPKLSSNKPSDKPEDKEEGERYKKFRTRIGEEYNSVYNFKSREEEEQAFYKSGETAVAFCNVLLQFDTEYMRIKRDEGKLDFSDLEQYTLQLLNNEDVLFEINQKFKYVYVDEYQDVNPVQEKIISSLGAKNLFLVGDVKQAIYGFRGSKSLFFAQKFGEFGSGEGHALKLSNNFRSSDGVINFVNTLFSDVICEETCDIDYKNTSTMLRGGLYPEGVGYAKVHVFGKEEKAEKNFDGVYSVVADAKKSKPSREGLAVVQLVKECLGKQYYDLNTGKYKKIETGDICVLTRKRKNNSVTGIVRALTDAGFSVSGSQDANICNRPEVKKMLDILSYIDNSEQDIPLATALLSPIGNLTENEIAQIKIKTYLLDQKKEKEQKLYFRQRCKYYVDNFGDAIGQKLKRFYERIEKLREYSCLYGAASLIDKILEITSWEAQYSRNGGFRLKNVRRLAAEAYGSFGELSLSAFLQKLKVGGYKISAPENSSPNSIKVMTMHASKGLEFPIVILADVARTFKGNEVSDMPYDDYYGFAPKYHDGDNFVRYETVLSKLVKLRAKREEYKNEANLYYVACTRAMYGLHVLVSDLGEFSAPDPFSANSYAKMTDLKKFNPEYMQINAEEQDENQDEILISAPDESLAENIGEKFNKKYPFEQSVDLPVKSSASQIMNILGEDEYFATEKLFPPEQADSSSAEIGIAYHRFLQLCDFSAKSCEEIKREMEYFTQSGQITAEQSKILSVEKLSQILKMSVFKGLEGATCYREREFLCRIPANEIFPTDADDGILIQGAIDLLAFTKNGCKIIDYKYSSNNDEYLKREYRLQLKTYKKAVSLICGIDEKTVSTVIVNIKRGSEIILS